jgi:hypothetical protein
MGAGGGIRSTEFSGAGQAVLGVTQHSFNLFASYTGKPFEKVIDTSAVFEICEQRLDRNPSAYKNPRSADLLRRPFDRRASAPVKHEKS